MAVVSQLQSQVRQQWLAHQGDLEARLAFNQDYFDQMKRRASEARPSGKCPWAFRLTAPGLDLALLNEQWRSLGFTLGERAYPYYLLTEIPAYQPTDLETKLWRGLIKSNYTTWYQHRLRQLVKALLALLVKKETPEHPLIQSYSCQPTDGLFQDDLQVIFAEVGWPFRFLPETDQPASYSLTRGPT